MLWHDAFAHQGSGRGSSRRRATDDSDSKALYPPGFENSSIDLDPGFRRIDPTGVAQFDDDLRLAVPDSPALGQGVVLADPDVGIDDPFAPEGNPDIGCFGGPDPGLRVGVDGRRSFPASDAD